ncbi:hypothetical protein TNCV_2008401 [Trichonephila clavipes]|nr:hypothetical protein TNCV_2008401 [Trichonephila clavipes]
MRLKNIAQVVDLVYLAVGDVSHVCRYASMDRMFLIGDRSREQANQESNSNLLGKEERLIIAYERSGIGGEREDDIEELEEILSEKHQETHRKVSSSEQEETKEHQCRYLPLKIF